MAATLFSTFDQNYLNKNYTTVTVQSFRTLHHTLTSLHGLHVGIIKDRDLKIYRIRITSNDIPSKFQQNHQIH
jgi:heme/copper-type cytochrome/quinol oxidase subunit 3